ncbi:hypothetical protein DSECCO2_505520 [anaerobic digester metagenome]
MVVGGVVGSTVGLVAEEEVATRDEVVELVGGDPLVVNVNRRVSGGDGEERAQEEY